MSDLHEALARADNYNPDSVLGKYTKVLAAAYREKCEELDWKTEQLERMCEAESKWHNKYTRLLEVAKRMHQDLYESTIPFYIAQRVQETRKQFEELIK